MENIPSILKDTEEKMKRTVEHLEIEFSKVRTGRANVSLVSGIKVNYYGAMTPLEQMGNVAVSDARTIAIRPWDATAIKEIEKALMSSSLGINPNNDGKVIRLVVPPLTGERRKVLVNQIKDMAEKAKIAIRNIRREAIKVAEDLKKKSIITEDDLSKGKKQIQDLTNKYEKNVTASQDLKKEEVMEV